MANTSDTQVLIAGGGPLGLTAAIELARRGIACRVVDPLQYTKAVGVQRPTLEVFEGTGVKGREFIAGDAAHIHPLAGAQGMNTGIQDAHNVTWKLALTIEGVAAPGLLESYDAGRRPVGDAVVGRTVRRARNGVGADSTDVGYAIRREAQLLIEYAGSPYAPAGPSAYVVRPDGYLCLTTAGVEPGPRVAHLGTTFAPSGGGRAR